MPIYEYRATADDAACPRCRHAFDVLQRIADAPLARCPDCGAPVKRLISAPAVGGSKSGLDDRAKAAGFHKFKRLGKGEYEKRY
jgi:putative FmdB family regulatory protein